MNILNISKNNYEQLSHIPDSEVKNDIAVTKKEVENFKDELQILERNPVENRLRIYMITGKIMQREEFIKNLRRLFTCRIERGR